MSTEKGAGFEVTPQSELGTRILMLLGGGGISVSKKGEEELVRLTTAGATEGGETIELTMTPDEAMSLIEALSIAARAGTGKTLTELVVERAEATAEASKCRRCMECLGQEHHFLEGVGDCPDCEDYSCGNCPGAGCKHCGVVADLCEKCLDHVFGKGDCGDCGDCGGTGVVNVRPGRSTELARSDA